MAIGDGARGIIANVLNTSKPSRAIINCKMIKPEFGETPDTNPDLFYTSGLYHMSYRRLTCSGKVNVKRFCITADFLDRGFVKFYNWRDLVEQSKTNDHVKFILEFTNIEEGMLNIAAQNERMKIPFSLDIMKYDRIVRPQTGKKEDEYAMIYNSFRPFFTSKWIEDENGEPKLIDTGGTEEE